jgi:hypothetical protein
MLDGRVFQRGHSENAIATERNAITMLHAWHRTRNWPSTPLMSSPIKQRAFTIISDVSPGADPLPALAKLDHAWQVGRGRLLSDLPELHYGSFVFVEHEGRRYLTFEGNIDGEIEPFWAKLAQQWNAELEAVYGTCVGFVPGGLVAHFREHDQGPGTWYVAWRGRSAVEIRREEGLRARIEQFLATRTSWRNLPPERVRAMIQDDVRAQTPLAAWAADVPERPFLIRWNGAIRKLIVAAGVVAVVVLVAATIWWPASRLVVAAVSLALGVAILYLRRLEKHDPEGPPYRNPVILEEVWKTEDHTVTNHMCGVTLIKRGRFRAAVLRLSLTVVGLAHRFWFNVGDLGGIPTIHFARWVVTKGGRDLIFFSNFNGSWEGYLGDFIDRASTGLNAIWSNTETYPKTTLLVWDGAGDEPRFKAFGRNSMMPTRVWYAAYPNLTVCQIRTNAKIREGLFANLDAEETRAWLARF